MASAMEEAEQGHADPLLNLKKKAVGNRLGKIAFHFFQDPVFVLVIKTFVVAKMVVTADCN